ncbi:hypothetical protein RJ640_012206 [Escallonia rubra]|uniref:UDP-glucose/GDP-mannose dehydrogenase N-terminal domain-containing protein n=1 Tax=Escallonia rubra TaxID=112253 RepID=A0AA88RJV7_9ASTE|nr:hypothetical protein RJ640_012206 [Escallonia rubra]
MAAITTAWTLLDLIKGGNPSAGWLPLSSNFPTFCNYVVGALVPACIGLLITLGTKGVLAPIISNTDAGDLSVFRSYRAGKAADLAYWKTTARMIPDVSKSAKIVVEKSTVPIKTAEAIKKILTHNSKGFSFQILSNPEFFAEEVGKPLDEILLTPVFPM